MEEMQFGFIRRKNQISRSYKDAHNFFVDQGTTKHGKVPRGFGHCYAHHQDLLTMMLITTLVVSFLGCCR